jgi:hypothetical protein
MLGIGSSLWVGFHWNPFCTCQSNFSRQRQRGRDERESEREDPHQICACSHAGDTNSEKEKERESKMKGPKSLCLVQSRSNLSLRVCFTGQI